MTVPGLLASGLGAVVIAFAGTVYLADVEVWLAISVVTLSGVAGSLVDSLLGASLQAGFKTNEGFFTEKRFNDKTANQWIKGWKWLGNDRVNMVCTLTGALLGCFLGLHL